MAKQAEKKRNISVNTEEPIDEKDLALNPLTGEEEEDEEDGPKLDEDELDPFGDKWEK